MKVFMVKDRVKPSYVLIILIGIVLTAYYFNFNNAGDEVDRGKAIALKESSNSGKVFFDAPKRIGVYPPDIKSSSSASNK